jgi:hypothetical protein
MKRFFLVYVLLFCSTFFLRAQHNKDSVKYLQKFKGATVAYIQGTYGYAEVGYFIKKIYEDRHGSFGIQSFSIEKSLKDPQLFGFKYGFGGGPGLGFYIKINQVVYTDFNKYSLSFQPEYGLGLEKLNIACAYNAILINKTMPQIIVIC